MTIKPLLILGVGNRILSDDGIGIKLIEDIRPDIQHPLVHFKTACGGGLEIVEIMEGYEDVIIFDAIKTKGGRPGSIYHFTLADFKDTLHTSSFHDISFLIALEFGKRSGLSVPKNIQILAVEIVEDLYFSENFSKEIQPRYASIKRKIQNFILKQLEEKYFEVPKNAST